MLATRTISGYSLIASPCVTSARINPKCGPSCWDWTLLIRVLIAVTLPSLFACAHKLTLACAYKQVVFCRHTTQRGGGPAHRSRGQGDQGTRPSWTCQVSLLTSSHSPMKEGHTCHHRSRSSPGSPPGPNPGRLCTPCWKE